MARHGRGRLLFALRTDLLRFNGKLFREPHVLPLDRDQIGLLIEAARADWRDVEPAIFGTLLERALNPAERHALGAHYTPRAYVERLVLPTVIEPLREDWKNARRRRCCWRPRASSRKRAPKSTPSTTSCARRACSTRPADQATSSTSRWST